jgi:hypothetical protein
MTPQAPCSQAPPTAGLNPAALLRIFSLVAVTLLFIAMTERDSRHDAHQRWLAEQRRRPMEHRLAVNARRSVGPHFGSHASAMMGLCSERTSLRLTDRERRAALR